MLTSSVGFLVSVSPVCYSSLVGQGQLARLSPDDYTKTPTGDLFVKPHVRKGLLPEILTELLEARANAKKLMKKSTDPFEQAVLNGRQLALKISANRSGTKERRHQKTVPGMRPVCVYRSRCIILTRVCSLCSCVLQCVRFHRCSGRRSAVSPDLE